MSQSFFEGIIGALPKNPNSNSSSNLPAFGGGLSDAFANNIESIYASSFYGETARPDPFTVPAEFGSRLPFSIANEYALYNFRGLYGNLQGDVTNFYQDQASNRLMGDHVGSKDPSASKIIQFFDSNYPKISYKPSDFLYSKYYKKIPINHLITLRRFPVPVPDNIYDLSKSQSPRTPGETTRQSVDATQVAGVTAVTFMGETAGNKLDDILSFTYGLNWKEIQSEMEAIDTGDGGYTQQPFYSKIGGIGRALTDAAKGVNPGEKFAKGNITTGDRLGTTYANFVLGPVNVVDKTVIRDRGLSFQNDMILTFEYELKSLNYVNPKIAMIDIISNMLTMTTNNAQFFGGGHRYYGAGGFVSEQFGDLGKLRQGDFAGYVGSVVTDVETGFKGLFGGSSGNFSATGVIDGLLKGGKTFLGNVLGQFLGGKVGGQTGIQATRAFISSEPTGNWHVTVGNPLNPIATMGNMYCDNVEMKLGHGLGYDDFPMEVKFDVSVKHGKPRDKGDIENMFNSGRGRIYASAGDEEDILNIAGRDVKVYGAIQDIGATSLQSTQSGSASQSKSNNGANASEVNDSLSSNPKKAFANATERDAAYTANLVSIIVDS